MSDKQETKEDRERREAERKKREEEYRLEELNRGPYDEKFWHGQGVLGWVPRF